MCAVIITLPELHYLHLKQMSFRCNVKSQKSNEVYLSNPISLTWASAIRHEALEATHACTLIEFEVRSQLWGQGSLGLHILKYDPTRVAETPLQMQEMEKYLMKKVKKGHGKIMTVRGGIELIDWTVMRKYACDGWGCRSLQPEWKEQLRS